MRQVAELQVQLADGKGLYVLKKASIEETVQNKGAAANKINWTLDNKLISESGKHGKWKTVPSPEIASCYHREEKAEGNDTPSYLQIWLTNYLTQDLEFYEDTQQ